MRERRVDLVELVDGALDDFGVDDRSDALRKSEELAAKSGRKVVH